MPPNLIHPVTSKISRREQLPLSVAKFFKNDDSVTSITTKLASVFLPFLLASSLGFPANAASSVFTNDFADPLHPGCRRHVEVNGDGTSFHYSGTSVGPEDDPVARGCSPQEIKQFGIQRKQLNGVIGDGNKLSVGNLEGVWEPAGSATTNLGYEDVDGIRWNDGNKWIVQPKTMVVQAGEIFFAAYIGFSLLAGVKGLYNMYEKGKADATN